MDPDVDLFGDPMQSNCTVCGRAPTSAGAASIVEVMGEDKATGNVTLRAT